MRKTFTFFISLFVGFLSLQAQTTKTAATNAGNTTALSKIDPQLLSKEGRSISPLKTGTAAEPADMSASDAAKVSSSKLAVQITCVVSPALISAINANGGDVLSSSAENNLITANVPAAALEKIAASADVKYIGKTAPSANMMGAKKKAVANAKTVTPKQGVVEKH